MTKLARLPFNPLALLAPRRSRSRLMLLALNVLTDWTCIGFCADLDNEEYMKHCDEVCGNGRFAAKKQLNAPVDR